MKYIKSLLSILIFVVCLRTDCVQMEDDQVIEYKKTWLFKSANKLYQTYTAKNMDNETILIKEPINDPNNLILYQNELNVIKSLNQKDQNHLFVKLIRCVQSPSFEFFETEYIPKTMAHPDFLRGLVNSSMLCKLKYMQQISTAISLLHKWGFVYCNLLPANILVTEDNRLVLHNFELTVKAKEQSCFGGTAGFSPPELLLETAIEDSDLRKKFDSFSLTVLYGYMLSKDGQSILKYKKSFEKNKAKPLKLYYKIWSDAKQFMYDPSKYNIDDDEDEEFEKYLYPKINKGIKMIIKTSLLESIELRPTSSSYRKAIEEVVTALEFLVQRIKAMNLKESDNIFEKIGSIFVQEPEVPEMAELDNFIKRAKKKIKKNKKQEEQSIRDSNDHQSLLPI